MIRTPCVVTQLVDTSVRVDLDTAEMEPSVMVAKLRVFKCY